MMAFGALKMGAARDRHRHTHTQHNNSHINKAISLRLSSAGDLCDLRLTSGVSFGLDPYSSLGMLGTLRPTSHVPGRRLLCCSTVPLAGTGGIYFEMGYLRVGLVARVRVGVAAMM